MPAASATLTWSFAALAVLLAGAFVAALAWVDRRDGRPPPVRRRRLAASALLTAGWLALTGGVAAAGQLRFDGRPPTMLLLLAAVLPLAIGLGASPLGARLASGLPLAVLTGFQGFRIAVELLIARAYREGLAPVQMTYHGRNFDLITGVTALAVAAFLTTGRLPARLVGPVVGGWNVLGSALLLNALAVAVLSAPTPFRAFHTEPANVWIAHAPWVWLPTVMVMAGALGHVLAYRRLRGVARRSVPRTGVGQ